MDPDGPDYNARPVRCRGCEARETADRAFRGIDEIDPTAGIKWQLEEAQ